MTRRTDLCSRATPENIDVGYDDVAKVVFGVTQHMRGGTAAQVVSGASLPGMIVGNRIASAHVRSYWLYLEYQDRGRDEPVLLEMPKGSSAQIIDKVKSLFGSRVTVTDFPEKSVPINPEDLKARKSKQLVKADKVNHPEPEVKPDKATIVVVCPPLAARYAGKGSWFRFHANDEVVAVNRMGTYGFAYLDPRKYRLVSESENANGFEMELEAGHEYFFLQNIFQAGLTPRQTVLSKE